MSLAPNRAHHRPSLRLAHQGSPGLGDAFGRGTLRLLAAASLLAVPLVVEAGESYGPFSAPGHPVTTDARPERPPTARQSAIPPAHIFHLSYRFYSRFVSPIHGARCSHRPTCSGYAAGALRRHGPVLGLWLTVDRLMLGTRSSAVRALPRVHTRQGMRFVDPLDDAFFWRADTGKAQRGAEQDEKAVIDEPGDENQEELSPAPGEEHRGASEPRSAESMGPLLQGAFETELIRDFADHLLEQGDAYRAIGEYKRYLFLAPGATDADIVEYRVALSYLAGEQNQAAAPLFERLVRDAGARPGVRHAAWAAAGKAFFELGEHGTAALHLEQPPMAVEDPELLGWAAYTRGHSRLKRFELDEAHAAFADVPSDTAWSRPALALSSELESPPRLSRRNPTLAGLLSLIPGLGHIYLGMWGTAFSAITWNGAFIWGMYETGRGGNWGVFALLALLESVWYTGTVYGAVSGAHRHNRDAKRNYIDALEVTHPRPGPPPQPVLDDAPPLHLDGLGPF